MKKLKQIGYILFMLIIIVLLNYHTAEAAGVKGLTTEQIFNWVSKENDAFIKLDAKALLKTYYSENQIQSTINEASHGPWSKYWRCIRSFETNPEKSWGFNLKNVIDIDSDGEVKVTYMDKNTPKTEEITKGRAQRLFNNWGYAISTDLDVKADASNNFGQNSYYGHDYYYAYRSTLKSNHVYYPGDYKEDFGHRLEALTSPTARKYVKKGYTVRILVATMEKNKGQARLIFGRAKSIDIDEPDLGNLKVIKKATNSDVKLKDVGFTVQQESTGKFVKEVTTKGKKEIKYVNTEKEAQVFFTNSKGERLISNLQTGTYLVKEVSNPNEYYEVAVEEIKKKVKAKNTVEIEMENTQVYVDLSGYVWEDKFDGAKMKERNDLYRDDPLYDGKDELKNGIKVRLMKRKSHTDSKTGQIILDAPEKVRETITSALGRYSATGKIQDNRNNGNGEYFFEKVPVEDLEDYYIEFEYDGMTYTNVNPHIKVNNGSKAIEGDARKVLNQSFGVINGSTAGEINQGTYNINARTDLAGYTISEYFKPGQKEITYINLGLRERDQPDLSLQKDLQTVQLSINGYGHTYYYNQRYTPPGENQNGSNLGVQWAEKELDGTKTYLRPIYQADVDYTDTNTDNELKVKITYKIRINNATTGEKLQARVHEVVDYYDARYEGKPKAGTGLNAQGELTGEISCSEPVDYGTEYKKIIINTGDGELLGSGETGGKPSYKDIYVQFTLGRQAVLNILNNQENLDNVAEINAYSIYDAEGNPYAAVDKDSTPGNCKPGQPDTYEDDTSESPSLKLEVAEAREIAGKVFLDETAPTLTVGEERRGSGKYEDNEKGIAGVKVVLKENKENGKTYDEAETNEEGDFLINGFIPGDYTLTYTWGDDTYTVQDFKGTIYDKERYTINQTDKYWYKGTNKNDPNERYSDAIDDYSLRQKIDQESAQGNERSKQMHSTTPTIGIGVEYETIYTASTGDKYTYRINHIDFGIVERARQQLSISKDVSAIKMKLANEQTIIDATVNADGTLTGTRKDLTYGPPNGISNGFVKAEIDDELIQGATLEITYKVSVHNQSELDYDSKEYYHFGSPIGDIISLKPDGVYDYLDNQMIVSDKSSTTWKVKNKETMTNEPTIVETYFNEGKVEGTDGTYQWETTIESYQVVFTQWSQTIIEESTETIRDIKIKNKTILKNAQLEQELKPGESKEVELYTSKVLANTDEINLNNDVEMTHIKRTTETGRMPDVATSKAYDRGETIIVTANTGGNKNYLAPIVIGAMAMVILGAGVVLIKKKVLK